MISKHYESWGRYPKVRPREVFPLVWRDQPPPFDKIEGTVLPFAYGRSYGDSCLTTGTLLDTTGLGRFMEFDSRKGLLRGEAGISLAEILKVIVPKGWFLPVTPGTKFVSLGGAIANDVHGKNHHKSGTFGRYVRSFELLRSRERLLCSPEQNSDFFRTTIGGLGLTGLILWAEIELKPIKTPFIEMERIRFHSLKEFFELAEASDQNYEYTVAWVDCLNAASKRGRGIFFRGNHSQEGAGKEKNSSPLTISLDLPGRLLNRWTIKTFNNFFYLLNRPKRTLLHYAPFFYPLDSLLHWNRCYGKNGFLQYQCVIPLGDHQQILEEILSAIYEGECGSFLSVLKFFGSLPSPGLLSFPRPGVTFALDFAWRGKETLDFLEQLDSMVRAGGGAVYPAKDARMSAESFQRFFPQWEEFAKFVDPNFSSSFWRRVTSNRGGLQ